MQHASSQRPNLCSTGQGVLCLSIRPQGGTIPDEMIETGGVGKQGRCRQGLGIGGGVLSFFRSRRLGLSQISW